MKEFATAERARAVIEKSIKKTGKQQQQLGNVVKCVGNLIVEEGKR